MLPTQTRLSISGPTPFSVPSEFEVVFREWMQANWYSVQSAEPAGVHAEVELLTRIRTHPAFARAPLDFRSLILNETGAALNRRHTLGLDVGDDLETALRCWEEAVQLAPPGRLALFCLTNLGAGLRAHYFKTGDPQELRRAITIYKRAIEQTPEESPDLPARLNNLGNALITRWEREDNTEDLSEALAVLGKAVYLTHIDSADLPIRLNGLARALLQRYITLGDIDDLHQAIETSGQAVRLTPKYSPDLPLCLAGLGLGLLTRYGQTNDPDDLQRMITLHEEAIRRSPDGAPEKCMYLNDLGIALRERYDRDGSFEDLRRSLEAYETAVHLTPARSTERPSYLNNLSEALTTLYLRTGRLDVLERAITVCREAVEDTPSDSPKLPPRLANLANGLMERYTRTVEPRDLEEATEIYEKALQKTKAGTPFRHQILNDLAGNLQTHALLTQNLEGVDRAIEMERAALEEVAPAAPVKPLYLTNLGAKLADRYSMSDDPVDLHQAIAVSEEALALTAHDSPNGPIIRINLVDNFYEAYLLTHDIDQLRQAIHLCEEALETAPSDSPYFPRFLGALGLVLVEHYMLTSCQEDLKRAVATYEKALTLMGRSLALSPLAYQFGPQNDQMEVYTGAALAFLQAANAWPSVAGNWKMKALAAVEATKSRLLTTLLARREIPAPSAVPADLVERERALVEDLASLDARAFAHHGLPARQQMEELGGLSLSLGATLRRRDATMARGSGDQQEDLRRWTAGHQALQEVLAEMERYQEARTYVALRRGDYLSPEEINRLAADLDQTTALLSLALRPDRTLLFAVSAGWSAPRVCEVPLGAKDWKNLFVRFLREVHLFDGSGRRGETWSLLMQPLLAQMAPHLKEVQHVVFIPHMAGHILPWGMLASQAGWDVTVSTAPALGLLERILRHREASGGRFAALVLGDPTGDLPYAGSEASQVAALFNTTPLIGPLALKKTVLKRLEREDTQLAHFATHAYFAPGSPLDSGVVLADGVLTAREILERELRVPPFVVLSACQTGLARAVGGDELAGLSQAFFAAGARSQLLSLWRVNDPATEHLVTGFYRHWIGGGMDKAAALRKATAATRLASPEWEHTYYWGAFTLVGDWR
jgi:CHAT domain-containing protein